MKARVLVLMVCISLTAVGAFAPRPGEEHVIGTVSKVTADSITVKTTTNKLVTVTVVPETMFMMGKMTMKNGDLKVGNRVVIHAKEDREGTLVANYRRLCDWKRLRPPPVTNAETRCLMPKASIGVASGGGDFLSCPLGRHLAEWQRYDIF